MNKQDDPELAGLMMLLIPHLKSINGVVKVKLKKGGPAGFGGYAVINVRRKADLPRLMDSMPPSAVITKHHVDAFDSEAWREGGASEAFLGGVRDIIMSHGLNVPRGSTAVLCTVATRYETMVGQQPRGRGSGPIILFESVS